MATKRQPSFKYIPGATNSKTGKGIPWMTGKFGAGTFAAGRNARLLGFNNVVRNLNIQFARLKMHSYEGLEAFAEYVYKDMQVTSPTIPEDTGKLIQSWRTERKMAGDMSAAVEAGFHAPYALYVHEMTDDAYMKKINWTKQGSGAKFFQAGLSRNAKLLAQIVALKTRIV